MPTATASKTTKARKPARAKAASARSNSAAGTQAKAAQAKGARTRAARSAGATARQAQTATRETADVFGDYAERAVLIPVGAALIARERVVSSVSDTISTYSSQTKTQAQLRRFERRGVTARKRLEREVRKARVRVERELRERRREIESTVSDLEKRTTSIAPNDLPEFANRVQERILSLV
jgi:hypothetical protein